MIRNRPPQVVKSVGYFLETPEASTSKADCNTSSIDSLIDKSSTAHPVSKKKIKKN